jgi:hypothetical protein
VHGDRVGTRSAEFADNARHLNIWIDRLDTFVAALGAIDADDPFDYCADAWEIWQSAATADPPPATDPASLVVLGVLQALANSMTAARRDRCRRADARRQTISAVYTSLDQSLGALRRECGLWLHDGAPAADEIKARSATLVAGLQASCSRADTGPPNPPRRSLLALTSQPDLLDWYPQGPLAAPMRGKAAEPVADDGHADSPQSGYPQSGYPEPRNGHHNLRLRDWLVVAVAWVMAAAAVLTLVVVYHSGVDM